MFMRVQDEVTETIICSTAMTLLSPLFELLRAIEIKTASIIET